MLAEISQQIAKSWLGLWDRVTRTPGVPIAQPPVESIPPRNTEKPEFYMGNSSTR